MLKFRPQFEELESRIVLDSYRWQPAGGTLTWSHVYQFIGVSNWERQVAGQWLPTSSTPGNGDSVYFDGGESNSECTLDVANLTLSSLQMYGNYSGELRLLHNLAISGTSSMESGAIVGWDAQHNLTLPPGAEFLWRGGKLWQLNVNVHPDNINPAKLSVSNPPGAASLQLIGSLLSVHGKLIWQGGDVTTMIATSPSKVLVQEGGHFEILAAGKTWGLFQPSVIENEGKVTLSVGVATVTFNSDYTSLGTTELQMGTLQFSNLAQQTGGTFRLLNGSIAKAANPTTSIDIRNGVIVGNGDIDGNLALGFPNANDPPTNPIISPGSPNGGTAIGFIAVTGNLHLFSGEMHIEYDKVLADYDRVVVDGYIAFTAGPTDAQKKLVGNLLGGWLWPDPFVVNTPYPFMTYTSRVGDFTSWTFGGAGSWISGKTENVNPMQYWFKKQGSGGGGGGSGGSAVMEDIAWDDKESDIGDEKAAVKLFDASGNYLAPSANDWGTFGGLGEGSYEIEYVDPSRLSAAAAQTADAGTPPAWSELLATELDEEPYDIDAELAWGGIGA